MRGLIFLVGCALAAQTQVWIDTDPSVARGAKEVDDGIALLQAFASPEISIRGVSIVFGNADLLTAERIGRELVTKFGPRALPVYVGAANAANLGQETAASRALAQALRQGRLTILVLGPATNVATVIRNHPELVTKIDQIVAVAGRRPGQRFATSDRQKIPFRDLNFELDAEAFRVLLASKVKLVFAPWEISSKVWLRREDIGAAASKNKGVEWLRGAAEDWLDMWKGQFGADGFNPFDALAVGFVVDRKLLQCDQFSAVVEMAPDDTSQLAAPIQKPYLHVRPMSAGLREVTYCYAPEAAFRDRLVERLSRINQ